MTFDGAFRSLVRSLGQVDVVAGKVSVGLHLGVHKTASTHLQHSLRNSSEALIEKGVRYYGPDFLRLRGRSIEQMFGLGTTPAPRRSTADQIAFLAKGDSRIFISEENFFGPLLERNGKVLVPPYSGGERAVSEFAGLLAGEGSSLDLYVAIRSPASFVTSRYSQILLSGTFLSPQDYAAFARPEGIDWAEMVAALASVPHKRNLYVWRYEDYGQILPSILAAMVGREAARSVAPAEKVVNPGFSATALRRYLVARERGNKWLTPARARRRYPVGPDSPPLALFSAEELHHDMERYDDQIARIRSIPGVTLIQP